MGATYEPLSTSEVERNVRESEGPRSRRWLHAFVSSLPDRRSPRVVAGLVVIIVLAAVIWLSPGGIETHSEALPWPEQIHLDANPYFTPGNAIEHNTKVAAMLDRCAELGLLQNTSLPSARLVDEENLIAQGCGTNQTTVVILLEPFIRMAFEASQTYGEVIYAQSVLSTLNALNYSYMFSHGEPEDNLPRVMELWRKYRWNIRLIIGGVDECWENRDEPCLRTTDFPEGIDAWRLFSFWYWDIPNNPLGAQWTLSPSHLNENFHLGYSIEPSCRRLPYIPPLHRASPPQAYVLAKGGEYLEDTSQTAWAMSMLSSLQDRLGISVVAGLREWNGVEDEFESLGLTSVGLMSKMDFYKTLAMSFVMIGVGRPHISPSPWNALCVGTPFINPIMKLDEEEPWNRARWVTQHWRMIDLDPPYVYHVHARNYTAFEEAVNEAKNNPIKSFIHPKMTFEYVMGRTAAMMERDWRGLAKEVLAKRIQQEGQVFEVF